MLPFFFPDVCACQIYVVCWFVYCVCVMDMFLKQAQRTGMTDNIICEVHVWEFTIEFCLYVCNLICLCCLFRQLSSPPADLTTGTLMPLTCSLPVTNTLPVLAQHMCSLPWSQWQIQYLKFVGGFFSCCCCFFKAGDHCLCQLKWELSLILSAVASQLINLTLSPWFCWKRCLQLTF